MNENILGYPITTKSKEDCIREITGWIQNRAEGKYLVCANPHSLETARIDSYFNEALRNADLIIPDGTGILIASKILGGNIRERVTGSDIFIALTRALNQSRKGSRYFFLGSTDVNLSKVKLKMEMDFPNIEVAGIYAPPFNPEFSDEENRLMVEAINYARPDILWVGMTAPKQEKWIYRNRNLLDVKFIGAVGAVFDFYAGNVKRPPAWFLDHGLEWLPRLLQEPGRLWKRTLISAPVFLMRVMVEKFRSDEKHEHLS